MGSFRHWFVAVAALAVVTSQPDSPLSPDADTEYPTPVPTIVPTHLPTLTPTYYPTFTRRPTLLPSVTPSPTVTFDPTSAPTHEPTPRPTPEPTATYAPTATGAPTYPTPPPTHSPTTWEPTTTPTLSPTTELAMFGQQFAIGISFVAIVVAYAIYSLNKPSELASRGLDYKMFRVREFKIEKRWYCKYCGFVRNVASGPDCRQCGTNQLGEQEILPVHTARGVATDRWSIRTPLVSAASSQVLNRKRSSLLLTSSNKQTPSKRLSFIGSTPSAMSKPQSHKSSSSLINPMNPSSSAIKSDSVSFGEGRRLIIWERSEWHFTNPHGDDYARLSELPATLALSELGFLIVEKGLCGAAINVARAVDSQAVSGEAKNRWSALKRSAVPKTAMKTDGSLEWVVAQGGVAEAESGSNASEVAAGMGMKRDPFEEANKMKKNSTNPLAQGTINVGGLYNDAITMRKCFYPEKVAWFYEQVGRLSDYALSENIPIAYTTAYPNSVLRDSYSLLTKVTPEQVLASSYRVQLIEGQSHSRSTEIEGEVEEKWLQSLFTQFIDPTVGILTMSDSGTLELTRSPISQTTGSERVSLFAALGRAIAMALVRRVFVGCELSPNIFKILVGEPLCFIDLVHSDQALFQDLLRLMLLPEGSIEKLHLTMPNTSAEGGTQCNDDGTSRNGSRDAVHWAGRGASVGEPVTYKNRLEYVFRKMEYQMFGRTQVEITALRNAIFEVIPQSLLQVFDYRELAMLLNGYRKAFSEDTFTVSI